MEALMKAFRDREFPKRSRGCTGINRFPFTQELAGERKKGANPAVLCP